MRVSLELEAEKWIELMKLFIGGKRNEKQL